MRTYQITNDDIICAQYNVESYAEHFYSDDWDVIEPIEKMRRIDTTRNFLYGQNVQRTPNVAAYIVTHGIDFNATTRTLFYAYQVNMLDKRYIQKLMEFIVSAGRPVSKEEIGYIAVLGSWVYNELALETEKKINELSKLVPEKVKKEKDNNTGNENDKKIEEINTEFEEKTGPLQKMIYDLIKPMVDHVKAMFPDMENGQAIPIASSLCCQNKFTIYQIMDSDKAINANVLDILDKKEDFIGEILLLDKNEFNKRYPKLTGNQERFWDSVKSWIYKQLENYATSLGHSNSDLVAYLTSIYGMVNKDSLVINLRTVPSQYPTVLECGRALFN